MKARTLAITALSAGGALFLALIGVMIWVYADEPRTGRFDASFSLIDDRGNAVDQSIFRGRPALVYFGYTNCPEVCPTTMYEVVDWMNALGDQGKSLNALFFSIDPERDTQEVMHNYVTAFSSRIRGITGSPDEMKKVADGWFIHAAKEASEDGDYHMSHTVSLLLIGADGRLKGLIPYGADREDAIAKIRHLLLSEPKGA